MEGAHVARLAASGRPSSSHMFRKSASVGPAMVTSVPPARITPADRFAMCRRGHRTPDRPPP